MKIQYRFLNCCPLSRQVITSLLITVVSGLLVVSPAGSADITRPNAPEETATKPTPTIPVPAVSEAEKNGSMEELVPASGEELDSAQGNDTPLLVVPPIERPSQRYFLSSFKLPAQLTFAGVSVPMEPSG